MSDRETDEALWLLRDVSPEPFSEQSESARRRRVVGRIDQLRASLSPQAVTARSKPEVATRPRSKAWLRAAAVALPIAAAVFVWLQSESERMQPLFVVDKGDVMVESGEDSNWLTRDDRWQRGDTVNLVTESSPATVVLPSRTSLRLDQRTRATVSRSANPPHVGSKPPASQSPAVSAEGVRVSHGTVKISAAQSQQRAVVVTTQQANVVVRGAVFAVSVTALGQEPRTRVVVHAGEAFVQSDGREYRLAAGQEWVSGPPNRADSLTPPASGAGDREASHAATSDAGTKDSTHLEKMPQAGAVKATASDLAAQNRLFEAAQAARRSGQSGLALRRFAELMSEFPASEQAHNARVEHFRLLHSLGRREEARRSARAYLKSYPKGFAASEARELTR